MRDAETRYRQLCRDWDRIHMARAMMAKDADRLQDKTATARALADKLKEQGQ